MNETPLGSSGAVDGGGPPRRGLGEQSPLQARAAFLKNWNWELVVSLNRAACERGRAQHGANPQVGDSCSRSWEENHLSEISLVETLDFLRSLHKSAPFLFFNGNTFADIGRLPRVDSCLRANPSQISSLALGRIDYCGRCGTGSHHTLFRKPEPRPELQRSQGDESISGLKADKNAA